MRSPSQSTERGSGTLLVLAVIAVVMVAVGAGTAIARIVAAEHRLDSAADLVALSAATAWADSRGPPCGVAGRAALAHGVQLSSCRVDSDGFEGTVDVIVSTRVSVPFAGELGLTSRARAGFGSVGVPQPSVPTSDPMSIGRPPARVRRA